MLVYFWQISAFNCWHIYFLRFSSILRELWLDLHLILTQGTFTETSTYMSQETAADAQRRVSAGLQLLQEVLAVEVPQFFQVPKNDAALPSQVLRQVKTLHLGEIVLNDVAERANVFPLCGNHFIHDVLNFTGKHKHVNDKHIMQLTVNVKLLAE